MIHNRKTGPTLKFVFLLILLGSIPNQVQARFDEMHFAIQGGPEYMYYFAHVLVGSSGMRQSAIIDTGSDTLAFPCDQCEKSECGSHEDPRFSTSKSNTFKYSMQCSYQILFKSHQVCQFIKSYAEGSSLLGFLATDYLKFKNSKRINDLRLKKINSLTNKDFKMKAEFGCTTKETGLFKTQYADGILGLDQDSSFIESVERQNSSGERKVFSFGLCFHNTGGIMSIDLRSMEHEEEKTNVINHQFSDYNDKIVAPYTSDNSYYEIKTLAFEVGNMKLDLSPINVMIDSGTTFTHFPTSYINAIMKGLNSYCAAASNRCGQIKNAVFNEDSCLEYKQPDDTYATVKDLLNTFPEIKFYFRGSSVPYVIYPKNYFYQEFDENKKSRVIKLCMALKGEEEGRIILGAFSMIDNYFYFDRKARRIRIVKEDCYVRAARLLKKERVLEELNIKPMPTEINWFNVGLISLGLFFGCTGMLVLFRNRKSKTKV